LLTRLLLCLTLLFSFPANAFEVSGNFWEAGQATYQVGMTGTAPSGVSWNFAFKRAMQSWSDATSFEFIAVDNFKDPCIGRLNDGFGDKISAVDFTSTVCGDEFGKNTLAVTLTAGTCLNPQCTGGFKITDADIVFKDDEAWDIYSGPLRTNNTVDFERVALHELGHALGLRHEESNSAIMQPLVSDLDGLQLDDINGANAIYDSSAPADTPVTTISSIYGVDIQLSDTTVINGPNNSVSLFGSLGSGDASLDNKFLDLHQFTFTNDSIVEFHLDSTEVDPFLYLIRVSSTQEAIPEYMFTDDNSGSGTNSRIAQSLQAGTYWLGVSSAGNNQQGSYELSFDSINNKSVSPFQSFQSIYGAEVQLNPNPFVSGSLNSNDFVVNDKRLDLYQFTVSNQVKMRIDLSSSSFDTELLLVRLLPSALNHTQEIDGNFILQNDDFGSSLNSRIEESLTPGTYWIGVTSANAGETGDYQIESTLVLP